MHNTAQHTSDTLAPQLQHRYHLASHLALMARPCGAHTVSYWRLSNRDQLTCIIVCGFGARFACVTIAKQRAAPHIVGADATPPDAPSTVICMWQSPLARGQGMVGCRGAAWQATCLGAAVTSV